MDAKMRGLKCKHIQADEIWSFIGKKQRNVRVEDPDEYGDAWVFVALDAQTKLIPAYAVGRRDRQTTYHFLCASCTMANVRYALLLSRSVTASLFSKYTTLIPK